MEEQNEISTGAERRDAMLRAQAHELRNHLYSIEIGLRMLKRRPIDRNEFDRICELMEKEGKAASRMVTDFLDTALERQD